jgi:hypothetical protein
MADLLRTVAFTLDRTETAFVASLDPRYLNHVKRDLARLTEAKKQVRAMLTRLPPEPPMSPEREQAIGSLIGAVLDKRFGDGSQEAVDEAIQAAFSARNTGVPDGE